MSRTNLKKDGAVSVPGFLFSSLSCGIKENRRDDLALIFAENPAVAAALFTVNELKAAPVLIGMENIKRGKCQAILANSGHANAMTGTKGMKAALEWQIAMGADEAIGDAPVGRFAAGAGPPRKPASWRAILLSAQTGRRSRCGWTG